MPEPLARQHGYIEEEYFVSGEAASYAESGNWGTDGSWSVTPATTALYETRMVIRRPADPSRFDGTVIVEWLNVSSGQDVDPVFSQAHEELLSHGTVWVGVSAQRAGIDGTGNTIPIPGPTPTPLNKWDPQRYGTLNHPGDDYSYDMFTQAGVSLLRRDGPDPLAGLQVGSLIAAGESQSAARMVTYVNAIHPGTGLFDGFLVHSRGKGGSVLHADGPPQPPFAWIRADLPVPVLQFETESDIFGIEFVKARQPDTDLIRTWEVAGTAHLDRALIDYKAQTERPEGASGDPITDACGRVNEGPQGPVMSAAISHLRQWVSRRELPPAAEQIGTSGDAIARDTNGIALGGVRTPPVDAPIATLRGDNPSAGSYACALFGSTAPFDAVKLASMYPTHSAYVDRVTRSATEARDRGFLTEAGSLALIEAAQQSTAGS